MDVRAAEDWFLAHGLPWFVDELRADVRRRLRPARLVPVLLVVAVLGTAAGVATGMLSGEPGGGVGVGVTVALAAAALYGLVGLHGWVITRWGLRRTRDSIGLLFPLATRALPMLLLFITFLFINAEVWQVAAGLHGVVLWAVVLLFGTAGVGFLTVRLHEELDTFDDRIDHDHLVRSCTGTPFETTARALVAERVHLDDEAEVTGLQQVNLLLVLLISQAIQVLLLSFAFFVLFGAIAIDAEITAAWTGHPATYPPGMELVSWQLLQVATFLAAFSGLYFTVTAVTDEAYRQQFFTSITRTLERAVNARVAYRRMRQY